MTESTRATIAADAYASGKIVVGDLSIKSDGLHVLEEKTYLVKDVRFKRLDEGIYTFFQSASKGDATGFLAPWHMVLDVQIKGLG